MKASRKIFGACLVAVFAAGIAVAEGMDDPGSKDHPLVSRYPGTYIKEYRVIEFDEFTLPLGKLKNGKPEKSQLLEGKITRIHYVAPVGRTVLEIFRNYESALKAGGFEVLFACVNNEGCGSDSVVLNAACGPEDWGWTAGHRGLSAKLARPEGDVYVSLHIAQRNGEGRPAILTLFVVELKPMQSGLVTVDASAMANDLTKTGHVALYGILFDTNKATLKPESAGPLKEIAKLLSTRPDLKLWVVGHTDSTGVAEQNMTLSRERADAVLKALTTTHGISVGRLKSHGCGPVAPVASNDSEDGRAKNRRVELVRQ